MTAWRTEGLNILNVSTLNPIIALRRAALRYLNFTDGGYSYDPLIRDQLRQELASAIDAIDPAAIATPVGRSYRDGRDDRDERCAHDLNCGGC